MAQPIDRRTFLGRTARTAAGLAVVGGAGGLLDACSTSGGGVKVSGKNRGGIGTGKPVSGGHLIFGVEAEETGFDPTTAHFDSTGVLYARTVYDPLAIPLADGTVVPYLAKSITSNPDFTEWTITLRPNLFFHDGTPCNADALKFCFDHYKASLLVNFALTYMETAKKVNDLAVMIKMNAPWVPFPAWLAGYIGGQIAYVFSPTQYNKTGSAPGETLLNSKPVGTGPFMYSDWVPGSHFTAVKNPHYWRKDANGVQLPYLDQITFQPLPIVSDRWTGLSTGTLDIIHTDDPLTILDIRGDSILQDVEDDNSPVEHDMDFGMINTTLPPLDDIRIRQAYAYGFNDANFREVSGRGITKASNGPFSPGSKYYTPTAFPTYNPAKAKALVQSYMHDHGNQPLTIEYGTTNTPTALDSAGLIQQYMTAIGITVHVSQVEQSAFITNAVVGAYHVYGWRQFANIDPDLNYVFWSSNVPSGGISVNFTRLKDPIVQKNIDIGRQSNDPAARVAAYQAVAQQFGKDCPYIWADQDVWCIGARPGVQNFNNPTTPDGKKALGMLSGIIWPTEIWKTA